MCVLDFFKQFFQSKLPFEITGKFREYAHIFVYVELILIKFVMADGRDCSNSKKGSSASYRSQIWSIGHSCSRVSKFCTFFLFVVCTKQIPEEAESGVSHIASFMRSFHMILHILLHQHNTIRVICSYMFLITTSKETRDLKTLVSLM